MDRYITLSWNINVNAQYKYDIKFGDSQTNLKYIGLDISDTQITLDSSVMKIDFETTYYWQII